ncbi:FAD-binding oxidoreductase [Streptomyces sp. NPDC006872]|uniref:FAD-binding oxidoreductase n=1 Tax=Streptomyces sp. NPDC006872 TaxID=3155720 RepID=UPI0033D05FFC
MPTPTAPDQSFPDFPADFKGTVLRPGDAGYDGARAIRNARAADAGPALIAQCADEDDVATVLWFAAEKSIAVAVRGGGNGADGQAMPGGALIVDLSALRKVTVDPETRIVRAQGGALLADLDQATQEYGLVVPAGSNSTIGVGGLTLGGGLGSLMRRFGATVDNLLACELVTADGRRVRADKDTNADLFWALRGGGGNFGVVTAFEFQAHQVGPDVVSGMLVYSLDQAADVLTALDDTMASAPRELGLTVAITPAPPLPMLPPEAHGHPVLLLLPVYSGDPADGEKAIAPLAALGSPLANLVGTSPWLRTNSMSDAAAPAGLRSVSRGGYLSALGGEAVSALLGQVAAAPRYQRGGTAITLMCLGGAISEDFAEDATAFSREGAAWAWEASALWDVAEQDGTYDEWAAQTWEALSPHTRSNGYINFTSDLGDEWRQGVWGNTVKFDRLQQVKAAWDPHNLLRHNANITPSAE